MKHEFHPDALDEYERAALYFEIRRQGLGRQFIESIEDAIARIVESPQ